MGGLLEYWNVVGLLDCWIVGREGLNSIIPLFHYSIIPLFHYSIIPLFHYSLFHYSTIPLFHYSTKTAKVKKSRNKRSRYSKVYENEKH
jgi:bacteriorhodopsin